MTYTPNPIDTSRVILSRDIEELGRTLAEHAHDIWARQRICEGWQWGKYRDDIKKEHPNLVPFLDLSESEQYYDQIVALDILKAIITLGYKIEKALPDHEKI